MELGKKTWVFADGDLPPQGQSEPLGTLLRSQADQIGRAHV